MLPTNFDTGSILAEEHERIQKLAISSLRPNPDQPRQHFDEDSLRELGESIEQFGIIQPLVATATADGYMIIAGERRWRAAKLAGLKHVPVIVRTSQELEQLELAIIENVQRVDLSPLEQAASIERLHEQFNSSYEAIAKRLGKAHSTVVNTVRLLQLPETAKQALFEKQISEGHARQLLALKDTPEKQAELLELIIKNGWSVRQAERFVSSIKEGFKESQATEKRMAAETPETMRLAKRYRTSVRIHRTAKGGRVEIGFGSDEELARLLADLER